MTEGDNLVYHMAEGDNLVYHMAEGNDLVCVLWIIGCFLVLSLFGHCIICLSSICGSNDPFVILKTFFYH
jgi:hypothetical protein